MLENMGTADWDFWEAADRLGLVPDPWMQTGRLAATIANRLEPILASLGGGKPTSVQATDFVPGFRGAKPSRSSANRRLTDKESEAIMRARYGKP